jgi:hypothetical protein
MRPWAVAAVALALLALGWTVRRNATLDAEIAALEAKHHADSVAAAEAQADLLGQVALSDSLRRAHAEGEARQAAARAASDRAARTLRAERDAALAAVADTAATVPELKATIVALVAASDSAQVAWTLERSVLERRMDERLVIMRRDSVALGAAVKAVSLMEQRARSAEALAATWERRARGQWAWKAVAAAGWVCAALCG